MKITNIETFIVPPRWCFCKITTDSGIVGWGEPVVEGRAEAVVAVVETHKEYLIGKDPMLIEDHWNVMHRSGFYRGGAIAMSAIAGIDQALWDIKGKYYNVPVHELMGGRVRDKIKVYQWIGGDRPNDVGAQAQAAQRDGFKAIKMNATDECQYIDTFGKVERVLERVAAIREACGSDFGIGIDFHGRVHKPMAKQLVKRLEEYNPMFIEEPVLIDHKESFKDVARNTCIPIATGERLYSRWDFKDILHDGYVDIIQPDLSHAGGITECKKIASMAEAYDVALAPHCPLGPIALASCLQVDATSYNAVIQEQSQRIHYNQGADLLTYVKNKTVLDYEDGFVNIPTGPGLGIEIDEEAIRQGAKEGHKWRNPFWRHEDGSVAEW
ncbi:hypothetical protein INT44_002297 [Umbelopsis vinacea]|uniref:Mandelate racemase/muconate lactonizing enzyme C-terminal domain-containing protein n=1 Tax=Umbelopsis vinacea TaxID=44442 RepID=A0A8H7Q311_9FUNG|nr:hypothetical protein INT44_002297 [Umbelopsis vinacea]KAI9285164.1 mandelate racemase/muconate lactonizing protein [Umbelopsis sp. AD052]